MFTAEMDVALRLSFDAGKTGILANLPVAVEENWKSARTPDAMALASPPMGILSKVAGIR
jgi:hypothetical protein